MSSKILVTPVSCYRVLKHVAAGSPRSPVELHRTRPVLRVRVLCENQTFGKQECATE